MAYANTLTKNAFWNVVSTVSSLLMVFFSTPLIIRNFGVKVYGIYVILGTLGGILSIASLGMGDATLKYVSQYIETDDKVEVKKVFTSTFLVYFLFGGAITFFLCFFPEIFIYALRIKQIDHARLLFQVTVLTFWIHLIKSCFAAIPQAVQRYEFCTYANILQNILQLVMVFFIIRFHYGMIGLIYAMLFNAVIMLIFNIFQAKFLLPYLGFCWPGLQGVKKVLSYGLTIFGGQMVGLIWQYSDSIILNALIGAHAVSYFSVPMQTIGKGFGLISAGSDVLFPRFSALSSNCVENKNMIKDLYVKTTQLGLFFSIAVCVPLSVMLPDFMRLWISPEFAEKASSVATILAASYIIRGAFLAYSSLLKGLGYPKYIFLITLSSSLCILFFDLIAIPLYKINGVGFSYVFSSSVGILSIILIFRKLLFIPMIIFWRDLILPYLVGLIILLGFLMLRSSRIWPHGDWFCFICMSAFIFIITLSISLGVSKMIGVHLYFKNIFKPREDV